MGRDCVIIGGGLTGLAAALELQKQNIDFTLIEVKKRLGGGIHTVTQDGFIIDEGPFAIADTLNAADLTELGLDDALYPLEQPEGALAFKQGAKALIDALSAKLHAPRMMRVAVSSIGAVDHQMALCFENGVMLTAPAIIIAIPARYAERLFYGYINPISDLLRQYRYDQIWRLGVGCTLDEAADIPTRVPDMAYVLIHRTTYPTRVPDGHALLQIGLRLAEEPPPLDVILNTLNYDLNVPLEPATFHMAHWPEADPLTVYDDAHSERIQQIQALLPPAVALAGSDYSTVPPIVRGLARLDDRIEQGRSAARRIAQFLHG